MINGMGARLGTVARSAARNVEQEGQRVAQTARRVGRHAVDAVKDVAGEAVGVAELAGFRYPVKRYQAPVSPGLTRGSRLDAAAMSDLSARGFHGVVNLCLENDADRANAQAVGMNSLHVPILDNGHPSTAQMKQFLDFVAAPQNQPAYVHCEAGRGRTGVAVACYRMALDGWSPEQALAEARRYGLSMPNQQQFIRDFGAELAAGKIDGYPRAAGAR